MNQVTLCVEQPFDGVCLGRDTYTPDAAHSRSIRNKNQKRRLLQIGLIRYGCEYWITISCGTAICQRSSACVIAST